MVGIVLNFSELTTVASNCSWSYHTQVTEHLDAGSILYEVNKNSGKINLTNGYLVHVGIF